MILSNVEIHRAIDAGRIVIWPEPLPRELLGMRGGTMRRERSQNSAGARTPREESWTLVW